MTFLIKILKDIGSARVSLFVVVCESQSMFSKCLFGGDE